MEPNLENLLQAWTPRPPSAEVREKLFSPANQADAEPRRSLSLGWLAPATICAFSMLMIFGGHSQSAHSLVDAETNLFFASMTLTSVPPQSSGASAQFALSKQDLNLEENVWHKAIFASTNIEQSPSSKRSLPAEKTNSLTL